MGYLSRRRGGSEPGEHPGLRRAGVLCKAGGGSEAPGVLNAVEGYDIFGGVVLDESDLKENANGLLKLD